MASVYIINYSDPSKPVFPVLPGTTDNSTSLRLPGHGVTSYGETIDEDLLHLLENFASPTSPVNPIEGQLWFDAAEEILKVWDATLLAWKYTGGILVGIVAPPTPVTGQLWYDTDISDDSGQFTVSQLKIWNGSAWVSVALNYVLKTGDTMSGNLAMGTNKITGLGDATVATDAMNQQASDARYVNISGDTMTGVLVLDADPTLALHAATKQYVDLMRVYDITGGTIGKPKNSTLVMNFVAVRAFTLPIDFVGSLAQAGIVGTAPSTFDIIKNGGSIGSLFFNTGSGTGVFTVALTQNIVAGDYLTVVAPATVDTTLADIRFTLKGTLV